VNQNLFNTLVTLDENSGSMPDLAESDIQEQESLHLPPASRRQIPRRTTSMPLLPNGISTASWRGRRLRTASSPM
jgi:hypothetical protein